jgi:hypothetical protein
MNKSHLASMTVLLLWAGVTLGQEQGAPTALPPEKVHEPATVLGAWEGDKSSWFVGPGPSRAGVFTADLEYVLWFLRSSVVSTPLATTNVLGSPDDRILGGMVDSEHKGGLTSGGRLTLGYWVMQDNPFVPGGVRDLGVETAFLFMGQRSVRFTDDATPNILRPFFDLNNRQESVFVVAAPGLATGGITARAQADIWGAEANLWKNVYYNYPGTTCCVNVLAGFRYLNLNERLDIGSTSVFNQNLAAFPAFLPFAGNTLQVADSFATHSRFYGGQIGIAAKGISPEPCLFFEGGVKLGIGATSEDLDITGGQVRTLANSTKVSSPGGLLALPSNIGHFHTVKFSQVPELYFKISAPLTPHLTFCTGFSALYWSKILRPGLQVDRALDITQIPNFPPATSASPIGLNQPGVPFNQSDLWVLGINIGLEVNY